MQIDFENITESSQWFDACLFAPYYRQLGSVQNTAWLRLGSPLIGVGDGLMSSMQAASGFGEALLKGAANTVRGIANRDSGRLKKGCLQIVLGGGILVLASIPVIAVRTLRITANIVYDPASAIPELERKSMAVPIAV